MEVAGIRVMRECACAATSGRRFRASCTVPMGPSPWARAFAGRLGADDMITADHRPHHVAVCRGVDLDRMSAELLGKKPGLSQGKGGHMHIYDPSVNFASSGIIAEGMAPAAGMALARRLQKRPGVAVSFPGEGAANQGAFHEVLVEKVTLELDAPATGTLKILVEPEMVVNRGDTVGHIA